MAVKRCDIVKSARGTEKTCHNTVTYLYSNICIYLRYPMSNLVEEWIKQEKTVCTFTDPPFEHCQCNIMALRWLTRSVPAITVTSHFC